MIRSYGITLLIGLYAVWGLQFVAEDSGPTKDSFPGAVQSATPLRHTSRFRPTASEPEISDAVIPEAALAVTSGDKTRETAQELRRLLDDGANKLRSQAGYTATFVKHEVVDDALQEAETIDLKLRHQPFSAYLKWRDVPQQVLFVEGRYDNKVLARMAGVRGLLGTLKLEPTSSLALSETRYPVTELGLLKLTERLIRQCDRDLKAGDGYALRQWGEATAAGRPCLLFVAEYDDRGLEPLYRKSLIWIDKEHFLPIAIKNYTWPADNSVASADLDEATFIEHYEYRDLQFRQQFAQSDFDSANEQYAFRGGRKSVDVD